MVRRVKAYLNKMRVMTDEDKLHELSVACEGGRTGGDHSAPNSAPLRKRNPSPTLSTTSSASSASEGRKPTAPKFGELLRITSCVIIDLGCVILVEILAVLH